MGRPKGSKNKPKDPNVGAAKTGKPGKAMRRPGHLAATKAQKKAAPRKASSKSSKAVEFRKPNPDELIRLVKQVCARAADQKSIGLAAKELIDKAAETRGLDKVAFGIFRKLWKMGQDNPEKLAVTLPHLLSYIDDGNLAATADKARGLAINGENDDDPQVDLEDVVAEAVAETVAAPPDGVVQPDDPPYEWPDDEQVAKGRLSIVPGPNAPVPEAPPAEEQLAEEKQSDAA